MVGSDVGQAPILSVSDFVAVINQAVEYVLPQAVIVGELANFKVSKGKWVYFDLKDDEASVRFFGTVYMLPGPLEDGMMLEVRGAPRLHPQFGFSVNVQSMRPVGEGAIKKAAQLLEAKLQAEGLFAAERKRMLPYPPQRIGLITSGESAAYADFIKVLGARFGGVGVDLADVQVQGERAVGQIVAAIDWFNEQADVPEVLVLIRGGGNADDLAAFSAEQVVRAVAGSRIPTLVAIGHEVDISLAELAADQRASTPSNAAELLVPDRRTLLQELSGMRQMLADELYEKIDDERQDVRAVLDDGADIIERLIKQQRQDLESKRRLAEALNPAAALARGFAIVRGVDGKSIRSHDQVTHDAKLHVEITDAVLDARVTGVTVKATKGNK